MSVASVLRLRNEADDATTARQLLTDVAVSTVLDPDLHRALVARPHCVSVIAMQVSYIVSRAAESKAKSLGMVSGGASLGLTAVATPLQTTVAIIGLGSVGTAVADRLVACGAVHPTAMTVVTRQQTFPSRLKEIGVRCFNNIAESAPQADVVIICCQPGQFQTIAKAIKDAGGVKPSAVVVSVCASLSPDKIATEIAHSSCVCTVIDSARIAQLTRRWQLEDQALAKQRRLEFASTKSMLYSVASSDLDPLLAQETPEIRHKRRTLELMNMAMFAEPIETFCRVLFALASAHSHRGLNPSVSVSLALEVILGVTCNIMNSDLRTACTIDEVALETAMPISEIVQRFTENFSRSV